MPEDRFVDRGLITADLGDRPPLGRQRSMTSGQPMRAGCPNATPERMSAASYRAKKPARSAGPKNEPPARPKWWCASPRGHQFARQCAM